MWLAELRIVLPERVIERGALCIEDGVITAVIDGDAPHPAFALPGLVAIPGVVDLHGDMLERDIEPRPNVRFPFGLALYELDKRLAASGITTHYAAVGFAWTDRDLRRQDTAMQIIETINTLRDDLLTDVQVHARFEVTNPTTLPLLEQLIVEHGIQIVSLNDHTPGQGQYHNTDQYVDFMSRWLGFDPAQVGQAVVDEVKAATRAVDFAAYDWSGAADIVRLAARHGIPVASHDDDSTAKVAQQHGIGVTISEFPVNLEAAHAARERGMHVIMGAPNAYRGQSSGNNLSALDGIRAGVVDSLATDYFPAAPVQAAFRLVRDGLLTLPDSINLITKNPADAVGLHNRGRIAVGAAADIALIDPTGDHPRVRATLRDGRFIYRDAALGQGC